MLTFVKVVLNLNTNMFFQEVYCSVSCYDIIKYRDPVTYFQSYSQFCICGFHLMQLSSPSSKPVLGIGGVPLGVQPIMYVSHRLPQREWNMAPLPSSFSLRKHHIRIQSPFSSKETYFFYFQGTKMWNIFYINVAYWKIQEESFVRGVLLVR